MMCRGGRRRSLRKPWRQEPACCSRSIPSKRSNNILHMGHLLARHETQDRDAPLRGPPQRRFLAVRRIRFRSSHARLIGVEYVVSESSKPCPQRRSSCGTPTTMKSRSEPQRAGGAPESGAQGLGQHVRQVLVHWAIRPR